MNTVRRLTPTRELDMPFDGKDNLIILPTYNERRNIEGIVTAIFDVLPQTHILIVDDNSPDGTGRLAEALASIDTRIFVLHRTKNRGLGPAYIDGFRWAIEGAGSYFGVEPDLMTFGKGMANGFSVAAVAGRREVMEVGSIDKSKAERVFLLSSTHGGEMSGLGAFIETVNIYKESDVCRHLWTFGLQLKNGINSLVDQLGIQEYFRIEGPPVALNYIAKGPNCETSLEYRTLFNQEMIRHGVLMPWIAQSWSHNDEDLDQTLSAAKSALGVYRDAIESGISDYLDGPTVKPVFRQFN